MPWMHVGSGRWLSTSNLIAVGRRISADGVILGFKGKLRSANRRRMIIAGSPDSCVFLSNRNEHWQSEFRRFDIH
ncbi:MAG: hypothetical protein CMB79_20140 [Filomicrobium sp.]|nr:hypothetical protein [Filomicrobium sp.]